MQANARKETSRCIGGLAAVRIIDCVCDPRRDRSVDDGTGAQTHVAARRWSGSRRGAAGM